MRAVIFLLVMLPISVKAGSGNFFSYTVHDKSKISLTGTTNINSYECISDTEIPRGYLMADIMPGSNAIFFSDAQLGIRVATFDCGNRLMNRDLHEALGGKKNPYIEIKLLEARPLTSPSRTLNGKIRVEIVIKINGKVKNTDLVLDYRTSNHLSYYISGSKNLKMSDFGIEAPSPALGLVKVRDQVTINFNLLVDTSQLTQN